MIRENLRRRLRDEWSVVETELSLERLASSESLFAFSNGQIGVRGNLTRASRSDCPAPT